MLNNIEVKLFVANKKKVQEGKDSGKWFDMSLEDRESIFKYLFGTDIDGDARDGDYVIMDRYIDDEIYHLFRGDSMDLDDIHDFVCWLQRLSNDEMHIFLAICEAVGSGDANYLKHIFDKGSYIWLGDCDNMDDAGEQYYKDTNEEGSIPEHIWDYVDFARWAEDNTNIVYTNYGYIEITD